MGTFVSCWELWESEESLGRAGMAQPPAQALLGGLIDAEGETDTRSERLMGS